jgi:hypothetical protein
MDVDTAFRVLRRITTPEQEEAAAESDGVELMTLVMAFRERLDFDNDDSGESGGYAFEEQEPAALFRLIELIRQDADSVERDLLRHMKFGGGGMTWEQVAAEVDGQIGGRQAMQKRWSRLTSANRRTATGDMRRGAATRRSDVPAAHRQDGSVVDTTTSTHGDAIEGQT